MDGDHQSAKDFLNDNDKNIVFAKCILYCIANLSLQIAAELNVHST